MPPVRYTETTRVSVCPWLRRRCSRCDTERRISRGTRQEPRPCAVGAFDAAAHGLRVCVVRQRMKVALPKNAPCVLAFSFYPQERASTLLVSAGEPSRAFRSVKSAQSRKTEIFRPRRDTPLRNYKVTSLFD